MLAAFGYFFTFHSNDQVFTDEEPLLWQQPFPFGFFKKKIFGKTASSFLEISRKHVFTVSDRNKNKLEQILSKCYSFLVQTLICIINFA